MSIARACPHCRTSIEAGTLPAVCPRCGKPLAAARSGLGSAAWYYAHNKQRVGPVSLTQLRKLAAAGEIQPTTMLLQEGSPRWKAAREVMGLFPPPTPPEQENAWVVDRPAASARRPRRTGERLLQGLARCRAVLRDMAVGSVREASRRVRRIALQRQRARLCLELNERLPGEVGTQLLSEGVALPGGEELLARHRELSRSFSLTSQAALAGNKSKKKESRELGGRLQAVCVEYGRRALQLEGPFPGRQQYHERQQHLAEQIRHKETERARLQAEWQTSSPASKRGVMAGWALAAVVPLLLVGAVLKGVLGSGPALEKPADLVQADAPEVAAEKAQEALVAAEGRVWKLQGEALREAQAILDSKEARKQLVAEEAAGTDREKQVRAFLRTRRSQASQEKARSFMASLSAGSQQLLRETAAGLDVQPEDFVLEWLTYEGALSLGLLTQTWLEQDSLNKEGGQLLRTVFEGLSEPPAPTRGVQVQRADHRIDVSFFGAHVTEEIAADRTASVEGDEVVLWWKSSYGSLRELMRGESPAGLSKKTIKAEQGRYVLDCQAQLDAFLHGGHQQPWAVSLYDESLATLVEAAQGTKGPGAHRTLQQLFARLSPAVPIIEAVGTGIGSGFLVRQHGKYLVVTNRHVIENAREGVTVHFLKSRASVKEGLTIPASAARVVAIHRNADLAVIDVSAAAERIRSRGIQPVYLAPRRHIPPVGAHVFAIGHPHGGGALLTQTLSDGIVSATGRSAEGAHYLQVTVPLNPGNSGGPLFDDEGRVVGVNTFVLRKNEDQSLALEALNFALEIGYVREVLTDPSKSLDEKGIEAVLHPPAASLEKSPLKAAILKMATTWLSKGYQPYGGSVQGGTRIGRVPAHSKNVSTISLSAGSSYAVAVVSEGAAELNLALLDDKGAVIASDSKPHPDPSIHFQVKADGKYSLVIANPSRKDALAVVAVFEK